MNKKKLMVVLKWDVDLAQYVFLLNRERCGCGVDAMMLVGVYIIVAKFLIKVVNAQTPSPKIISKAISIPKWLFYFSYTKNSHPCISKLSQAISSLRGESLQLEGMYPGYEGIYRYPLNLEEE
jgi:hypothetical protein